MLVNERSKDKHFPDFDNEASLREARSRSAGSLESVLEQYGHGPRNGGSWKNFTCPHCNKKKAGLFTAPDGTRMFKCFSDSCPSRAVADALDDVGYIAFVSSLSRKDAFQVFLKQTGVWEERVKYRGAAEDKPRPKTKDSAEDSQPSAPPIAERADAGAISAAGEVSSQAVGPVEQGQPGHEPAAPNFNPPNVVPFPAATAALPVPVGSAAVSPAADSASSAPASGSPPAAAGANALTAQPMLLESERIDETPREIEEETEPDEETGHDVLRRFFSQLALNEQDEALLYHKRGLSSLSSKALGFRSNPKSNSLILQALANHAPYSALLTSGLFKRHQRTMKPNAQFYGAGIIRKLKEAEISAFKANKPPGQWIDDEGTLWGWVHPILIPYLSPDGGVIGLRPHKGGAAGDTICGKPRIYIPRRYGTRNMEKFRNVAITEGEFKAAGLWQTIGAGSILNPKEPWGVMALPGIHMSRNAEMMEELHETLREWGARRVVVVFDNEDKSSELLANGQPNPAFKADKHKRHDAQIMARVLATDLSHKLHIIGLVGNLPNAWRDDRGKADWDGALARMVLADGHHSGTDKMENAL